MLPYANPAQAGPSSVGNVPSGPRSRRGSQAVVETAVSPASSSTSRLGARKTSKQAGVRHEPYAKEAKGRMGAKKASKDGERTDPLGKPLFHNEEYFRLDPPS